MYRYVSLWLILVLLSACGSAGVDPAENPLVNPTPTPPSIPKTPEPSVGADSSSGGPIDLEPTTPATRATGTVAWHDQIARLDAVTVQVSELLPLPSGEEYHVWLVGQQSSLPIGTLTTDGRTATLTYESPTQENLLGLYSRVVVGQVPVGQATETPQQVILSAALPGDPLVHIRHGLVSFSSKPGESKIGFLLGLRQETDEVNSHAEFLQEAYVQGDFPLVKIHAEHIINIIQGSAARDVNGDGNIQNPGDGFGLVVNGSNDGYVQGTIDHAVLAATAPGATERISLHAEHVRISSENVILRLGEILTHAEQIAASTTLEEADLHVKEIVALADQTVNGVDRNLDEQVGPIEGEGGVLTAYQHAQLMAGLELAPVEVKQLVINDNTFAPQEIEIVAGTSVLWEHTGQRTHTVTSDDGSFNSGDLKNGATFTQIFDTPGVYGYFCELHGGSGNQGMAGTIVVTEADSGETALNTPLGPGRHHPLGTAVPPTTPTPTPAPETGTATVEVSMTDFAFASQEVRFKTGTTVLWSNDGAKPHSARAVDASFDTGLFQPGESKQVTFNEPGTFKYYCELHGSPDGTNGMVGTIIVED